VLKEITVDYVNLNSGTVPIEYEFLKDRFPQIALKSFDNPIVHNANVIVLDLLNNPTRKPLADDRIRTILQDITTNMNRHRSSIVIYFRGEQGRQSPEIGELDPDIHAIPANGRIALIGSTISAAYVADTLRRRTS
jgi:hypothetical protein